MTEEKIRVDDPRPVRLDLACGWHCKEGFRGIDKFYGAPEDRWDLFQPWPIADSSVDELHSSHFIEHIPARTIGEQYTLQIMRRFFEDCRINRGSPRDPLASYADEFPRDPETNCWIAFFNEAFRVAKPGAAFALQWPALQSVRAFQDPTHRRFIPMESLLYLSKEWRILQGLEHYLGATCDWIVSSCSPTIVDGDTFKSELAQRQAFRDHWNFANDFVAVLKAVKHPPSVTPG